MDNIGIITDLLDASPVTACIYRYMDIDEFDNDFSEQIKFLLNFDFKIRCIPRITINYDNRKLINFLNESGFTNIYYNVYDFTKYNDEFSRIVSIYNLRDVTNIDKCINLEYLYFNNYFNNNIEPYMLPNSLKYIEFGTYFNQPISINVLPNSLTYLKFGSYYSHIIEESVLPNSLEKLIFDKRF